MTHIDTSLAVVRSLIKQLSNDNWIHYAAAAPPQTALISLSKAMRDINTHIKFISPEAAQIFDVPDIRWQEADYIDTENLYKAVKSLKPAQMTKVPVPKQIILDSISAAIKETLSKTENSFSLPSKYHKYLLNPSQFIVKEVIGKGTFSVIYKVIFKNEVYALKFFMAAHLKYDHFFQFISELDALSSLKHSNIIKFKGVLAKPFCLLTEYVPCGSLFSAIRSSIYPSLPLDRIAEQIRQALFYCHKNDIVHGDVKSLNILLTSDFDVKLCDFGSARRGSSTNVEGPIGTPAWSAPELFQTPRVLTHKCDTYSFGVVLLEMATRKLPNPSNRIVPSSIPNRLRLQIENLIAVDPQLRPPLDRLSEIHFKAENLAIDGILLDYMLSLNTIDTIHLLADIVFEMPETSSYLVQKVAQMPLPQPDRLHSVLRLLRSLCNSEQSAAQLIQFGAVALCMKCLDSPDLQVSALFLLISILIQKRHFLPKMDINGLRELDDSDLAVMVMMLGGSYNEADLRYFLSRLRKCHDRLISVYLVSLRIYLSQVLTPKSSPSHSQLEGDEPKADEAMSSGMQEEVFNTLVEFLRLNDEVLMKQVLSFLIDIAAKTDKLRVADRQILLISKWVFVKNVSLHEDSLNLLSLLYMRKQISVECEMNDFCVIILHSLPLSTMREKVTNLLLRILDEEKRARWFANTQLDKVTKIAGEGIETRRCLLKIIVMLYVNKAFDGTSKDTVEKILKVLSDVDTHETSRKILRAI